jgi:hypothetical protein
LDQRRQEDDLIASRYQLLAISIGIFEKSGLLKDQISLILTPNHSKLSLHLQKVPTNTTLPSIRAQINHNPETHSHFFSQNRH